MPDPVPEVSSTNIKQQEEIIKQLTEALEKVKVELAEQTQQKTEIEKQLTTTPILEDEIRKHIAEKTALELKLAAALKTIKQTTPKAPPPEVPNDRDALLNSIKLSEAKTEQFRKEVDKKNKEIVELEEEISKAEAAAKKTDQAETSYLALVLQWATEKHDLDLVVKDNKNQSYNFKNRSYEKNGASLSLDSRTGPGVELWQSGNASPGTYSSEISLYNTYGNDTDTEAKLIVFTSKGRQMISIPKLNKQKKSHLIRFTLGADGSIKVL